MPVLSLCDESKYNYRYFRQLKKEKPLIPHRKTQTILHSWAMATPKQHPPALSEGKTKDERESRRHVHRKETHGMRNDIDEDTLISEIKGPSVFQRAKEEIEALVETIHPKKDSYDYVSWSKNKEGGGLLASIGRWLEKLCCPRSNAKDL